MEIIPFTSAAFSAQGERTACNGPQRADLQSHNPLPLGFFFLPTYFTYLLLLINMRVHEVALTGDVNLAPSPKWVTNSI